jgi:hypothetical protein
MSDTKKASPPKKVSKLTARKPKNDDNEILNEVYE